MKKRKNIFKKKIARASVRGPKWVENVGEVEEKKKRTNLSRANIKGRSNCIRTEKTENGTQKGKADTVFEKQFEGKEIRLRFHPDRDASKKNFVSFLPGGKNVLLDKSQKNLPYVECEREYLCLVHKELPKVAFCKILSTVPVNRVIIKEDGSCVVVLSTDKEKTQRQLVPSVLEAMRVFKEYKISKFEVITRRKEIGR